MKRSSGKVIGVLVSAAVSAALSQFSEAAITTTNLYFDVNGTTTGLGTVTNNGSYSWDDTTNGGMWNTSSTGAVAPMGYPASTATQFYFPEFPAAGTSTAQLNYAVSLAADEQLAGLFVTGTYASLTFNATGSGALDLSPGVQGVFSNTGVNLTINAPIVGTGGFNPKNGGSVFVNGVNTYTGGTSLTSTSTLIHFNNGSAFGTGSINLGVAGYDPLLASGGTLITLANPFVSTVNGAGINFAADANTPVTSTGNWSIGTNSLVLRNNTATSLVTISGVISGTGGVTVTSNTANNGTIVFGAVNTYTGSTTIGISASAAIRLVQGINNAIASSSSVILAGGTLSTGGFSQTAPVTPGTGIPTLGLTVASTFDYTTGTSEMDFANSSGLTWTSGATINLLNFNPANDFLRFGTDATGLTAAQLNDFKLNGVAVAASLSSTGYLQVPEPASLSLLGLAALGVMRRRCR